MSRARAAAVWCAMALLGAPLAGAAAYRPWLPFGYQGSLSTCYEDRCDVYGRALVLQGDRRLLIGAGPDVRGVLPGSGAADPTFRAPRVVTAADGVRAWIPQLATTPDGEVLVGVDALEGRGSIRRLGLDGELQLGFAGPVGAFAGLGSLPDGRFVAFRSGDARQGEVWRFLRDGQPDPGFGTGGRSTAAVSRAIQVRALAADPFGRLLVAGSMLRSALTGVVERPAVVLRLGADGLVDASFGEGGVAVVPLGDFGGEAIEVLVEPDGGMLVVGNALRAPGTAALAAVVRLGVDGRPDAGYGHGGRSLPGDAVCSDGDFQAQSAIRLATGGIAIAAGGWARGRGVIAGLPAGYTRGAVLGLDRAGLPDPEFGACGAYPSEGTVFAYVRLAEFDGDLFASSVYMPDGGYQYFDTAAQVQRLSRSRSLTPGRLQYLGAGGGRDALRPAFERLGGDWGRVTLGYSTADGTAIAGRDYAATSGELVWEDGDSQGRSFQIPVLGSACSPAGGTPLELSIRFGEPGGGATFAAPPPARLSLRPCTPTATVTAAVPTTTNGGGGGGGGGALDASLLLLWSAVLARRVVRTKRSAQRIE